MGILAKFMRGWQSFREADVRYAISMSRISCQFVSRLVCMEASTFLIPFSIFLKERGFKHSLVSHCFFMAPIGINSLEEEFVHVSQKFLNL